MSPIVCFDRYGAAYASLMNDLGPTPVFDDALIDLIGRQTDAMEHGASPEEIRRWRDRMVGKLTRLKAEDPQP